MLDWLLEEATNQTRFRTINESIETTTDALGAHETIGDYQQAMEWGIDLIQTDHPLRVMRAIELWVNGNSRSSAHSRGAEKGSP